MISFNNTQTQAFDFYKERCKYATYLRWNTNRVKRPCFFTHLVDSPEYKTINRQHKTFGAKDRNMRFGMCRDGMNPFDTRSSYYSTQKVLIVIYNLPTQWCMKSKHIFLSLLVLGNKQPRNDIDIHLPPFVELRKIWDEGIYVFDAHANEVFTLCAMHLCVVIDFQT